MTRIEDSVYCDGCGVEILLAPVIVGDLEYCCQDCADGYECDCGLKQDLEDDGYTRGDRAGGAVSLSDF